ncbi:MAG: hypothetical protein ACRDT2_04865 [Natronosporangium sp.]
MPPAARASAAAASEASRRTSSVAGSTSVIRSIASLHQIEIASGSFSSTAWA